MSGEAKTDAKAGRTIPFFKATIGEEEIASVVETLRSGWLTSGPKVRQFESEFAQFVGAKHAVAINSCLLYTSPSPRD